MMRESPFRFLTLFSAFQERAMGASELTTRSAPANECLPEREVAALLGAIWVCCGGKNAFGCHSAAGCRFVERMLTVVQTLRLQNRPVLDYVHRAIVARRAGLPAPQLLSQAGH